MVAVKSSSNVLGVTYVVIDAASNNVVLANGQPTLNLPLQPQVSGSPTAMLMFTDVTVRLTQANALAWPYSAGQSFTSASGDQVNFVTPPSVYAGGTYESANTGGVRMVTKGVFVDFTAGNMTDLVAPLSAFGSSGAVT